MLILSSKNPNLSMNIHCPKCHQELTANPKDYEAGRIIYCMFCSTPFQKHNAKAEQDDFILKHRILNVDDEGGILTPEPSPPLKKEANTHSEKKSTTSSTLSISYITLLSLPFYLLGISITLYYAYLINTLGWYLSLEFIIAIVLCLGLGCCIALLQTLIRMTSKR